MRAGLAGLAEVIPPVVVEDLLFVGPGLPKKPDDVYRFFAGLVEIPDISGTGEVVDQDKAEDMTADFFKRVGFFDVEVGPGVPIAQAPVAEIPLDRHRNVELVDVVRVEAGKPDVGRVVDSVLHLAL